MGRGPGERVPRTPTSDANVPNMVCARGGEVGPPAVGEGPREGVVVGPPSTGDATRGVPEASEAAPNWKAMAP